MRKVLVTQGKGGGPKTATARNLAVAAAVAGQRVATLDTDPQGSLTYWHSRRPQEATPIEADQVPLPRIVGAPMPIAGIDLLIIDTPTAVEFFPEATAILFDCADLVLVPVRPGPEDLVSMEGMMPYIRSRRRPTRLLLSQTSRSRQTADARERIKDFGAPAPVEIPHLAEVPASFSRSLGTVEISGTRTGPLFSDLWTYVADTMGVTR
ncbi:chromosome partitioning protein ParA [Azospirillum baldaniorum]|uniref:Partition protein (ParA) n=1 Tax=Azospirillum baldaniorum TaxID=1064539 RepID=A0A9P1JNY2_9PROT|nr:ParA family protein [Azospirillum baldaniorum]AWJ88280.1 chromosome partitioning protein ParA [Azospirillum baldaniorum]TWA79123.1 chromosome partitioning protein [Azospirillum brasilense]CCC96850.1 putative partition protein (ParA) [Azospirillum baldaniorum]